MSSLLKKGFFMTHLRRLSRKNRLSRLGGGIFVNINDFTSLKKYGYKDVFWKSSLSLNIYVTRAHQLITFIVILISHTFSLFLSLNVAPRILESSFPILTSHGCLRKRRIIVNFDYHREEAKKHHLFGTHFGFAYWTRWFQHGGRRGPWFWQYAANSATSSVKTPSKKQRMSEAGGVVLLLGFFTPLPPAPVPLPTLVSN